MGAGPMDTGGITVSQLHEALANKEFEFFYQPILSLLTGQIDEAEALIRWRHGDELIMPGDFIPLAEKTGVINEVTRTMFPRFCEDLARILEVDDSIVVSFNISAKDLTTPKFVENLLAEIDNSNIRANNVKLELTESAALKLNKKALRAVAELKASGISLSIDDFGTGNATFENLKNLPFDTLKIDRSISQSSLSTPDALTLLDHSVNLGHQLNLDTVAEGVETDALLRYVCTTGCEHIQGYIISKALPMSEFIDLIRNHRPVAVSPIGGIHKARIDYCDWVRRVFGTLYMTGQTLQIVSVNHEATPVGKWLFNSGIGENIDNYDAVVNAYRRSHELSRILINAKSENDKTLMRDMLPDFLEATCEVNELLHVIYINECKNLLFDTGCED